MSNYFNFIDIATHLNGFDLQRIRDYMENYIQYEPNTGCSLWIGDNVKGGYGRICINRKKLLAHRVMYYLYKGDIPKSMTIDHVCNNPFCVNPIHLQAISMKDNTMRGSSFSKINSLKTHCPQHHEYDEKNTFKYKDGRRGCRACMNKKSLDNYYKKKYNKTV